MILWSVCYLFRDGDAQDALVKSNGLTKILLLMQSNCSPVVRQMSGDLLKIFRVNSKFSSCLSSYDTKTTHIMPFWCFQIWVDWYNFSLFFQERFKDFLVLVNRKENFVSEYKREWNCLILDTRLLVFYLMFLFIVLFCKWKWKIICYKIVLLVFKNLNSSFIISRILLAKWLEVLWT